ncbi:nitrate- and nitrite sensing domain-containing protein [Streptomyces sp. CMSTAAHL-2]|uniref:sensor histidine kinase n=1 Tax=Streptomyces sp. CMSTAAHL-2 TaxID=2904522 RepID=UPI001E5F5BB1|nr:nitrate- and nitrite sensing domain-containing protein [Streptomyces sp. CMSTAAHL-2]MCE3030888.1 nitrate- and nitrite sensing domain-containing protein [Streptomyces sp. CMSTAAHL-2]
MRWPLGRPTTVRTRIVALALAPAVALMALWGFAMVSVTAELRALIRVQGVYGDFGTPVDTAVGQIQIERRMSAAYLGAGGRDAAGAGQLLGQQRRTDQVVDAMRQAIRGGDRSRLTARQRQSLDAMLTATDRLDGLRQRVLTRKIGWDQAVEQYSALIEPTFDVQSTLTALQAGQLARETETVFELVRVREFVSREDALVAGARAAGTALTPGQYNALTQTIEDRRVFQQTYVPDLPADSRALFEKFQDGALYRSLNQGEDALLRAGAGGAAQAVAADSWRSTVDRIVKQYRDLCTEAGDNSAARGRAFAYQELTKAAIAGAAGLIVAGLSLWFAVRGARRISRRLEALRDAADVLAGRQLPDVMRRLGAGEEVDAVAEAPPLAAAGDRDDEIGQVGRSFNTARLAAVEAAVKQATLRRGLFAVLLNIARRNQALVHRQLKLVDTLERRTEDPDVLRELFRIDHLTTRMRRHAESLIILSGSAPGRRWRRPVPIAQVVSSAVGEIEDYARVVVPPMPDTGIAADAVADVVHLFAELLENATVFSPPHTQVTLRTGRVGGGFVLEIDDRGLGLDAEAHAHAERTLTDPDAFDPTRHDRLGLYVVGRLAARHGIDVTLRDSPYGGTTAVVLLPESILAEPGGTDTPQDTEPPTALPGTRPEPGGPRVPLPPESHTEVRPLPSRRGNGPAGSETPVASGAGTGRPGARESGSGSDTARPEAVPTGGSGVSGAGSGWDAAPSRSASAGTSGVSESGAGWLTSSERSGARVSGAEFASTGESGASGGGTGWQKPSGRPGPHESGTGRNGAGSESASVGTSGVSETGAGWLTSSEQPGAHDSGVAWDVPSEPLSPRRRPGTPELGAAPGAPSSEAGAAWQGAPEPRPANGSGGPGSPVAPSATPEASWQSPSDAGASWQSPSDAGASWRPSSRADAPAQTPSRTGPSWPAQPDPLPVRHSGPSEGDAPWQAPQAGPPVSGVGAAFGSGDASHSHAQPDPLPARRPGAFEPAAPWESRHVPSPAPRPGTTEGAPVPPLHPTRRPDTGEGGTPAGLPHTGAPGNTPPPALPTRHPGTGEGGTPAELPRTGTSASTPPPALPTRRPSTPEPSTPEPSTPETGTPEPGPSEPGPSEPGTPEPGPSEPRTPDASTVVPALPTRVRQASLARQLRDEPQEQAEGGRREVDAEEMRAIFGAFQRGLDQGRKGMPARPGATEGDTVNIHVDEGTDTDDAR